MEIRTIKLNQSAIDSAVRAYEFHKGNLSLFAVSNNCPIFHALNEAGLGVDICGLSDAMTTQGKRIALDRKAMYITHLPSSDWAYVHPDEFTVKIS